MSSWYQIDLFFDGKIKSFHDNLLTKYPLITHEYVNFCLDQSIVGLNLFFTEMNWFVQKIKNSMSSSYHIDYFFTWKANYLMRIGQKSHQKLGITM